MTPYYIKNSYHSQIEGRRSLVNFRIGYTCFGIAWPRRLWKNKKSEYKYLPHLSISLFAPVGQCGQVRLFKLEAFGISVAYRIKGDATPDLSTYYDAGWEVRV
jgi:hypothetical protein